jgi:hypothetical protein
VKSADPISTAAICTIQLKGNNVLRIGFLHAGDQDDDPLPAGYELGDDGNVRITAAFSLDDNRFNWWGGRCNESLVHDPESEKSEDALPSEMTYRDAVGNIGLIECTTETCRKSVGIRSLGCFTLLAQYTIESPQNTSNYQKINGLRSEIDGLTSWLGIDAHAMEKSFSDQGIAKLGIVPNILLSQTMRLTATVTDPPAAPNSSETTPYSTASIQTAVDQTSSWEDHLTIHGRIRDLLRIAGWKKFNFLSHKAYSSHESQPAKDGEPSLKWRNVQIAASEVGKPHPRRRENFLFRYPDVSDDGIDRWLHLAQAYQRGLDPFVSLLNLSGATIDAMIAQLGIALEAIGYQVLVANGLSSNGANKKSVRQRIEHLVADIGDGVLSFNASNFGEEFASSFNSAKHANLEVVAPDVKQEHFWQGVELVRKWIALRLGVSKSKLYLHLER